QTKLGRVFYQAGQELTENVRAVVGSMPVLWGCLENVSPSFPQTYMDMTRVPRLARRVFRHEGDRLAVLVRDLLDALLQEDVYVRDGEGIGVSEIDVVLGAAPFAFAALDGHAGGCHAVADDAHQWFVPRRLHQVIIDAIVARRLQVPVTANMRRMVGLIK